MVTCTRGPYAVRVTVDSQGVSRFDTGTPHSARVWNYWLGGKDNFAADRQLGDQILALMPELVKSVRADRAFLGRVVRYLAGKAGIRQFLDIGTGLPTADNTHEVAQSVVPDAHVVYVDNDPIVLAHARALLTGNPPAVTAYIDADLKDPGAILRDAARTLDFAEPVAVLLLGSLNFVEDDTEAHAIVRTLVDGLAPGSYLVVSHPTDEVDAETSRRVLQRWNSQGSAKQALRDRAGLVGFFDGLELVGPGVVSCSRWQPDGEGTDDPVSHFGAVARKP
jgi:hypothetical protein